MQFSDDVASLEQFDEGAELVETAAGDLCFFLSEATRFAKLDLSIMKARYWRRCVPPPGPQKTRGKNDTAPTPETPFQRRCLTKEGTRCGRMFASTTGRMAHEVRATDVAGTHGLKLYATTASSSGGATLAWRTCTARNHVVQCRQERTV